MKKIFLLIFTILALIVTSNIGFASGENQILNETNVTNVTMQEEKNQSEDDILTDMPDNSHSDSSNNTNEEDKKMSPAGEEIVGAVTKKDRKIAELTDKYNDKTLGMVAYYLEVVRYYSTPIFFIFLTIGAFNFFIVGNKKLDKKEQGFGWITACIIGWVFFQCVPLVFALFAI